MGILNRSKFYNLTINKINQDYLYILLYCLGCGIFLRTFNGDSAIFLSKDAIISSLKSQSLFQYQGLIEYVLMSFSWDGLSRVIIVKTLIILINLLLFRYAFFNHKKNNIIEILCHFTLLQFYLAPSSYSYAVSGFSLVYLASKQTSILKSSVFFVSFIIFCGTDLPNPKYLGLGIVLYLFLIFYNNDLKILLKFIIIYFINLFIFFVLVFLLYYHFINNGGAVPNNYDILNNSILLDLVDREYISAILPYKKYRYNTYTYLLLFLYIIYYCVFSISLSKNKVKKIICLILLIYISLGILDPLSITSYLISIFPQLSFLRTRAGFDLLFYVAILSIYVDISFENNIFLALRRVILSLIIVIYIIQIPSFIKDANSFTLLKKQGEYLDFIDSHKFTSKSRLCVLTDGSSYEVSDYFGFGPPLYKLSTNGIPIKIDNFEFLKLKLIDENCSFIFFNSNILNKVFISNILFEIDTKKYYSFYPYILMALDQ
jgi:hypothetical protein